MLLTNLTIARFQRKIRKFRLARSLAISYICFQVRIVKKKKKSGGGEKSHTINYYGISGDSRTPDPWQGLYTRNCNGRNYTSYHSWRPSWRPLFAENSRASGGSAPWAPGRGPMAGPWTPPVWGARFAHTRCATRTDFSAHPFFLQILDPPLYTSPLARPSRLPPEASILGELGSRVAPPPPQWKYFFFLGGSNISKNCPPPPPPIISSTCKNRFHKHCNALEYHSNLSTKNTTKHTQFSFLPRALREKLDIATLRAKRAEKVGIFLTFTPPPHPKNGSMPLLAPPDEVCQVNCPWFSTDAILENTGTDIYHCEINSVSLALFNVFSCLFVFIYRRYITLLLMKAFMALGTLTPFPPPVLLIQSTASGIYQANQKWVILIRLADQRGKKTNNKTMFTKF